MATVRYEQWRDHERQRVQTNDTVMGLLAGSKLAAQTLGLTAGSSLTLSDIFPRVEHIQRFNLRADRAREVLDDAEDLLGILAVPQILALHEDLLRGMGELLVLEGRMPASVASGLKAANVHESIEASISPARFTRESVELFHLTRVARNTYIHSGGRANATLLTRSAGLSSAAHTLWRDITNESVPTYALGDTVRLGLTELIAALAVTKRLAEEANVMLQSAVARPRWADMLVAEWLPARKPGNRSQWIRKLRGLGRMNYAPLGLSDGDLDAALIRAGL